LLNIPIPPIFVFAGAGGIWELVDGLQRVSTVLEFVGLLRNAEGALQPRFRCDGTDLLPSLVDSVWPEEDKPNKVGDLPSPLQLTIRRARIRVEILGQETDPDIKFELFQRLNSGGANLSEQEMRDCIIVSINRNAYRKLAEMSHNNDFLTLTDVGDEKTKRQFNTELAVRFVVLRNIPYQNGVDVHEYLDRGVITISKNVSFDWDHESELFALTMRRLKAIVPGEAFRKSNRFSIALFEFVSLGLSKALEGNLDLTDDWIRRKVKGVPLCQKWSVTQGVA